MYEALRKKATQQKMHDPMGKVKLYNGIVDSTGWIENDRANRGLSSPLEIARSFFGRSSKGIQRWCPRRTTNAGAIELGKEKALRFALRCFFCGQRFGMNHFQSARQRVLQLIFMEPNPVSGVFDPVTELFN